MEGGGVELLGHRHEGDAVGIEQLHQLGKVRERAGQPVDLVDNHNINPAVPDVGQQSLERGALGRAAGIAAVVVAGTDRGPAVMALAADIGFRGPSCWASSELNSWSSPYSVETGCRPRSVPAWIWRSCRFLPAMAQADEEAWAGPAGAGHGKGDLGQAAIGGAVPVKAIVQDHDALRLAVPLPHQDGARLEAVTAATVSRFG